MISVQFGCFEIVVLEWCAVALVWVRGGSEVVDSAFKGGSEVVSVDFTGGSTVVVSIVPDIVGDSDDLRLQGPKFRIVIVGSLHFFCAKWHLK